MKIQSNDKNELKITSQDWREVATTFSHSLTMVKSDKDLLNWMQRIAMSYEQTKKANRS